MSQAASASSAKRYTVVDFDEIPAVPCPCGTARRALAEVADFPATIHRTTISAAAQTHYHRRLTETYYILECEPGATLELDGEALAAKVRDVHPDPAGRAAPGRRPDDDPEHRRAQVRPVGRSAGRLIAAEPLHPA